MGVSVVQTRRMQMQMGVSMRMPMQLGIEQTTRLQQHRTGAEALEHALFV